jgi:hypothetical protein
MVQPSLQKGFSVKSLILKIEYGTRNRYSIEPNLPLHKLAFSLEEAIIVHLSVCALKSTHRIII